MCDWILQTSVSGLLAELPVFTAVLNQSFNCFRYVIIVLQLMLLIRIRIRITQGLLIICCLGPALLVVSRYQDGDRENTWGFNSLWAKIKYFAAQNKQTTEFLS